MKKILKVLMAALLLTGCSVTNTQPKETSEVKTKIELSPSVSASTIATMFNDEALSFFSENYGGITYITSQLSKVGTEFEAGVELTTYDGDTINLEDYKDKNVMMAFVADWCSYCQEESKSHLEDIMESNPEVEFIQIFVNGNKSEIDEFYSKIGQEMPENLTIIPQSEVTEQLATYIDLQSFPTLLFKDDANRIGWIHSGLLTSEQAEKVIEVTFGEKKLYNMLKEGYKVTDLTRDYKAVKADLSEEAITLVSSINSDAEAESTIYGNLAKEMIPTDFLDLNGTAHKANELSGKKVVYSFLFASTELEANRVALKAYEELKAKNKDTLFVTVLMPYTEGSSVKSFVSGLDYKVGDIVIDASETSTLPTFFADIDLFYVPTILFQNESNLIAGGIVGEFSVEMFQKGFDTFYSKTPIYTMLAIK